MTWGYPLGFGYKIIRREKGEIYCCCFDAIAVPCMAQIAMVVGLLGKRGGQYVTLVFLSLFLLWSLLGGLLHRILKGESRELTLEIPPYRIPLILGVIKKLWIRITAFLISAVPYVLLGILLVNILYILKIIDFLSIIFSPLLRLC